MDTGPTDDRPLSNATLTDFLSDLENHVDEDPGGAWSPGLVFQGDTEDAGMVEHEGALISAEEYERRLQAHKKENGLIEGIETVVLNVIGAGPNPFEKEIREPE